MYIYVYVYIYIYICIYIYRESCPYIPRLGGLETENHQSPESPVARPGFGWSGANPTLRMQQIDLAVAHARPVFWPGRVTL